MPPAGGAPEFRVSAMHAAPRRTPRGTSWRRHEVLSDGSPTAQTDGPD